MSNNSANARNSSHKQAMTSYGLFHLLILSAILLFSPSSFAVDMLYCPQKQGYIKIGMKEQEVLAACGEPLSKQEVDQAPNIQVPVKQLIFTRLNESSLYPTLEPIYEEWSLPSGTTRVRLEVDVINDKVSSIRLNGSDTNAVSICQYGTFQVGDEESKVLNACGSPELVNNTFIYQPVPTNEKPQIWIYQINPYQPPVRLTFVDGELQSIN
ncbi:DUF2845 domain-containing protein [Legionella londiniensis]|uniref:DUF2845 domain-containing protein n=1 Tax=Legionella londiniensis TaxID=45068 RepID=A0A0W0VQZ3_9GAMM|nr:DUF2845 domain-containing protein [Legionella londiniensis]KTD22594.1 hypothetical protein Llon_0468 [Legionella londiniensis]STX92525.1 Protein of uncharacterised function (DUF2845) [Legionella londiniensis]